MRFAAPTLPHDIASADASAVGAAAARWRGALLGAGTALIVGALAAAQGGYFPTSWGWGALLLAMPAAIAWASDAAQPLTAGRLAIVGLTAAITAWTAISTAWSISPDDTVLEAERGLLLVAAAAAAATFVRARRPAFAVGGVLAAIAAVCCYSLATRLFPNRLGVFDPLGVYRLADPIGYWNGLAVFAAFGLLLAWIHVARARHLATRCAAAASVPVVAATFYFTFGRAAWIALALGIAATVALDARRLQLTAALLTLLPTAGLAVLASSRADALTHQQSALAAAVHDGHRVALAIVALALVAAAIEGARTTIAQRVTFARAVRLAFATACLLALLSGIVAAVEAAGGPRHLVHRARTTFEKNPATKTNLNERLFSFSANGRVDLWRVAWKDAKAHPVLGSGAGTFERYWLQRRPTAANVRDAHSLYLETLAELGPLGLALVVALLLVAFGACVRARRSPLVPAIGGVVVAYAAHAAADWDWELAVLGVVVVVLAVVAMAAGEIGPAPRRAGTLGARVSATVVAGLLAVVAAAGLAGNEAVASSQTHSGDAAWSAAADSAARAHRFMPWSAEPWRLLGEAQQGAGDLAAARKSYAQGLRDDPDNWLLWLDDARASTGAARARALRQAARLNPLAPEIRELGGTSTK